MPHSTAHLSRSLCALFGVTLLLLFLNYQFYTKFKQAQLKLSLAQPKNSFSLRPSSTLNHGQEEVAQNNRNHYTVLTGTCFDGYDISHTNNKPNSHDACFAACLAWNSDIRRETKCVGWTSRKGSLDTKKISTKTCFLKSKLDQSNSFKSSECSSAELWKDAVQKFKDLDEQPKEDYYESAMPDSYLTDDGFKEYYYYYSSDLREYEEQGESFGDLSSDFSFKIPGSKASSLVKLDDNQLTKTSSEVAFNSPISLEPCRENSMLYGRPVRIYITCLQSSGCTLLPFLMAQSPKTISILDAGVRQEIPSENYFKSANNDYPNTQAIIIKHPLRGDSFDIASEMELVERRFKPDIKILFLRNPVDTFLSLINHIGPGSSIQPDDAYFSDCNIKDFSSYSYGLRCGTPLSKLRALNKLFILREKFGFKLIIKYEELCSHAGRDRIVQSLLNSGFFTTSEYFSKPQKTIVHEMKQAMKLLPSIRQEFTDESEKNVDLDSLFWGAGNLQNTFHSADLWESLSEDEMFKICASNSDENRRLELLHSAGRSYNSYSLQEIFSLVTKHAPDLVSLYNKVKQ